MGSEQLPTPVEAAVTTPVLRYARGRPRRRWAYALALAMITLAAIGIWKRDELQSAWQLRYDVYQARTAQLKQIEAYPAPGQVIATWKATESTMPPRLRTHGLGSSAITPPAYLPVAALQRRSPNGTLLHVVIARDRAENLVLSTSTRSTLADVVRGQPSKPLMDSRWAFLMPHGDWELFAPTPDPTDESVLTMPYRRGKYANTLRFRLADDGAAVLECDGSAILSEQVGRLPTPTAVALPTDETTFVDLASTSAVWANVPWPSIDLAIPSSRHAVVMGDSALADVTADGTVRVQHLVRPSDPLYDADALTSDGRWTVALLGSIFDVRTGQSTTPDAAHRGSFKAKIDRYHPIGLFSVGYWSHGGGVIEMLQSRQNHGFELPVLAAVEDPKAWRLYTRFQPTSLRTTEKGSVLRITATETVELEFPAAPPGARSMSISPDERWVVFGYKDQRWLFIDRWGKHAPTVTRSLFSVPMLDAICWSPDSRYFMFTGGQHFGGTKSRSLPGDYAGMIGRPEQPRRLGILRQTDCLPAFSADGSAIGWTWNGRLRVLSLHDAMPAD